MGRHRKDRPADVPPPNPATSERDYTPDEVEFQRAIEAYKKARRRPFPSWSEVLWVARTLGYRKAPAEPEEEA